MTKPSTRKGKTNENLPQRRSDRVLRDVLKIATRIFEERAELGDGEELAGAVLELDELIRVAGAPMTVRSPNPVRKRRACPRCRATEIVPIIRGLPDPEGERLIEAGLAVTGGCRLFGDRRDPTHLCRTCGHEYRPRPRRDRGV